RDPSVPRHQFRLPVLAVPRNRIHPRQQEPGAAQASRGSRRYPLTVGTSAGRAVVVRRSAGVAGSQRLPDCAARSEPRSTKPLLGGPFGRGGLVQGVSAAATVLGPI